MLSHHSLRLAGVLLAVAISSTVSAGWHGGAVLHRAPMLARQPLPPLAGIIHERAGRGPILTTFGHTAGAISAPARGYVVRGYGPAYGSLRGREAYEGYRRRFGYYPRYDYAGGRSPYGYGYGYGAGGQFAGGGAYPSPITAPDTGGYVYAGSGSGYVEPSLGSLYAEPPLDQSYGYGQLPPPSSAPQVINVNPAAGHCSCGSVAQAGNPAVYRYGVGSPY